MSIYGSADVVGLMCLKVFVKGDDINIIILKECKKTWFSFPKS